jgi:hypothetical protein
MARYDSGARWDDPNHHYDEADTAPPTNMSINPNQVSGTLPTADVTAINTAFTTIDTKLPFARSATPTQRQNIVKAGDKSRNFVELALAFAAAHPETLPANFDAAAFAGDGALYAAFAPIATTSATSNERIQDTLLLLNSDLMIQSLMVYAYAKAANITGGMDEALGALGARWAHAAKKAAVTPTPTPNP